MSKSIRKLSEIGLSALAHSVPVPGLSLLLNTKLRRKARRATGLALLGAGAAAAIPIALYVICKTSEGSKQTD
jgi:hypothetical protein